MFPGKKRSWFTILTFFLSILLVIGFTSFGMAETPPRKPAQPSAKPKQPPALADPRSVPTVTPPNPVTPEPSEPPPALATPQPSPSATVPPEQLELPSASTAQSPNEQPVKTGEESPPSPLSLGARIESAASGGREWLQKEGIGGHARFDYYSASKRLDNIHSLPGLTLQPKFQPKFGSWGDAKIEGRLTDPDLGNNREPKQARLLEAYSNLYLGSVDVRVGKQNIPWGRADALNPTDNLTPKDFTLLSARDEEERRIGTLGVRTNYYRGDYTLSLIYLPIFNPSTIPLAPTPGIQITEDKRSQGKWNDQALAAKLDHTGGAIDWSLSYYYGLDVLPFGRPLSPTQVQLVHNRIHVIGADFAKNFGRYGVRGEMAYTQTQDPEGTNPFIQNPFFMYVLGVDRDITEDLNINVQAYQRTIINFKDPFAIQDPLSRNVAVLSDTFYQQLDQYQGGFTSRIKATWLNKTLEGEILGMLNLPRTDFFLRPSLTYAFTDVWKGFIGWDIFNGQKNSFFGRLEPNTAFFVEIRASL